MDEKKIESVQQEEITTDTEALQSTADEQDATAAEPKSDTRKKILILVLSLLCVAGLVVLIVFRSGIPLVDFWTIAGGVDPVQTEIESIERIEGAFGNREGREGALALYVKSNSNGGKTQTVVHLLRKEVVASFEGSATVQREIKLHAAGESVWFSAFTTSGEGQGVRYSLALYDEGGKVFARRDNMTVASYQTLKYAFTQDLVRFGQDVYRVEENGTVRLAFTMDAFANLPAFTDKVDGYYFVKKENSCYVYNDKAELTATYHVPAGVMQSDIFILSDGTLLAQYVTYEGENVSDYTYYVGKDKYKIHHILISARNGAQTTLKKPEFFITSMISDDEELRQKGLNTGIANLVKGYYVKDGLLDKSEHALTGVLMSNRGRITSEVGDIIPAMYGGEILGVAKNRWIAKNLAGERFLLNEWGAIVGRFPDESAEISMAASVFVCEGKIYSWDLELLYDMRDNGADKFEIVGSSVVMYKESGEALLFDPDKGTAEVIVSANAGKRARVLGSALIAVEQTAEGKKQFELYNEHFSYLTTIEAEALEAWCTDLDGKRMVDILAVSASGNAIYVATVKE